MINVGAWKQNWWGFRVLVNTANPIQRSKQDLLEKLQLELADAREFPKGQTLEMQNLKLDLERSNRRVDDVVEQNELLSAKLMTLVRILMLSALLNLCFSPRKKLRSEFSSLRMLP